MSGALREIVADGTLKTLVLVITDENDVPVDLTGYGSNPPRLQGKSAQGTPDIDKPGTVVSAANGQVKWEHIGDFVTQANLASAGVRKSVYTLRVKYWDATAKFDYGDEFQLAWVAGPLV